MPEIVALAHRIVEVASERQATDILLLDIRNVCSFTDCFVIATAQSRRQMDSLSEDIEGKLKESGAVLHHREGTLVSGWILLDFGDVIVHLFSPEEREHYNLERHWAEGQEVVRIQ